MPSRAMLDRLSSRIDGLASLLNSRAHAEGVVLEVPDGWNPDDVWAHHLTVYPADVHAKWCLFLPPHQLSAADRHPGWRSAALS